MNSLFVAGISVFLLILGYVFYSRKVKQWLGVDDNEPVVGSGVILLAALVFLYGITRK